MREVKPPAGPLLDDEHEAIFRHIDRWLAKGLITEDEALAIREFESGTAAVRRRRVPLAAEALAYLGAALAIAAGLTLYLDSFEELTRTERLAAPAAVAVAFLAAGWPLRQHQEPAVARVAGSLWLLSAGAFIGFMAVFLFDVPAPGDWAVLVLGAAAMAYGSALLALHPSVQTHIAAFIGAIITLPGAISWWDPSARNAWIAGSLVTLGAVWLGLSRIRALRPPEVGYVLGALVALYGPTLAFGDPEDVNAYMGEALLAGVAIAVGLLAAGAWLHSTPVLALAGIGSFGYLFGSIVWFLRDTLGTPLALLLGGVALLAVALLTMRLGSLARRGARGPGAPSGPSA